MNRLLFLFLLVGVLISNSASVTFAETLCHITDPKDATLNVRDAPAGNIVNKLRNERVVSVNAWADDAQGRRWAKVSGTYKSSTRLWGWVFAASLRCMDTTKLPRETISSSALSAAGILPHGSRDPFPISCDIVANGWGVSISSDLYQHYRDRGFSEDAVCLALGSTDVKFDPETGKVLPLYEDPGNLVDIVYPLTLPDCFKTVHMNPIEVPYMIVWRPTNCTVAYHPTTGMKISDPTLVELVSGGEAGAGSDEENQSSTVSEERLKKILRGQ